MVDETNLSTPSEADSIHSDIAQPEASGEHQTPIDEEQRHTGMTDETAAKSSATSESGTSEQPVEGAPNQGTEKR